MDNLKERADVDARSNFRRKEDSHKKGAERAGGKDDPEKGVRELTGGANVAKAKDGHKECAMESNAATRKDGHKECAMESNAAAKEDGRQECAMKSSARRMDDGADVARSMDGHKECDKRVGGEDDQEKVVGELTGGADVARVKDGREEDAVDVAVAKEAAAVDESAAARKGAAVDELGAAKKDMQRMILKEINAELRARDKIMKLRNRAEHLLEFGNLDNLEEVKSIKIAMLRLWIAFRGPCKGVEDEDAYMKKLGCKVRSTLEDIMDFVNYYKDEEARDVEARCKRLVKAYEEKLAEMEMVPGGRGDHNNLEVFDGSDDCRVQVNEPRYGVPTSPAGGDQRWIYEMVPEGCGDHNYRTSVEKELRESEHDAKLARELQEKELRESEQDAKLARELQEEQEQERFQEDAKLARELEDERQKARDLKLKDDAKLATELKDEQQKAGDLKLKKDARQASELEEIEPLKQENLRYQEEVKHLATEHNNKKEKWTQSLEILDVGNKWDFEETDDGAWKVQELGTAEKVPTLLSESGDQDWIQDVSRGMRYSDGRESGDPRHRG
jgi:hypothetical protein